MNSCTCSYIPGQDAWTLNILSPVPRSMFDCSTQKTVQSEPTLKGGRGPHWDFAEIVDYFSGGLLIQFSPPRATGSTTLFFFRYGAFIAEVQSGGNLCSAEKCIFTRSAGRKSHSLINQIKILITNISKEITTWCFCKPFQARNSIFEREMQFSYCKGQFHWKISKSMETFSRGTKAKTRGTEATPYV